MDIITKSYLKQFTETFEINEEESIAFEHFCNHIVLEKFVASRFDIEEANIGKNSTIGIDGFAIVLNGNFINNEDELIDILTNVSESVADVIFIQSKRERNFDTSSIGSFGFSVKDFISEKNLLAWSDSAKNKINIFNKLIENSAKLKHKPNCHMYYITLGTLVADVNRDARRSETLNDIKSQNVFGEIEFKFIDADGLQTAYKDIGKQIEKNLEFPNRITLPEIEDITESYLGYIKALDLVALITNNDNELIQEVFYDNVRDYQGANKVNHEIANTLKTTDKTMFIAMNNGVTILTEKVRTTRNQFTLVGFQIINGCQTSHVLYDNRDLLSGNIHVPIRLIVTASVDVTSKIIRATNRQTEVKEEDLLAFTNFQKKLEDFYAVTKEPTKLYYERRSKQYARTNIERKRIVDKASQIKCIGSYFKNRPHRATRFFGTLFQEYGSTLFQDDDKHLPYYLVSYILYLIDDAFRKGTIDSKFKKVKYFILMMFKYELNALEIPQFNSKDMDKYCDNVINALKEQDYFNEKLISISEKIENLGFDLNNSDLSKSGELTEKCISIYKTQDFKR